MFSQHSSFFSLIAVAISSGFLVLSVDGACTAGAGCLTCNANNSADCTSCEARLGLSIAFPRSCQACSMNSNCVNCTSMSLCTQCNAPFAQGPYKNGTGACGLCSSNCTTYGCADNGAEHCDKCDNGYQLNNTTKKCEACKVVNCTSCTNSGLNACDRCISKNNFVAGSNRTKCAECSANCDGCASNGGNLCDYKKCQDPYGLNNATKLCEPCAANCTSCPINGYGLCDTGTCSPGYALNSINTCEIVTTAAPTKNTTAIKTTAVTTTVAATMTTASALNGTTATPASNSSVVSRADWGAIDGSQSLPPLTPPIPYIVVHHTRNACTSSTTCLKLIKDIQTHNKNLAKSDTKQDYPIRDIVYNFLIDPFGTVYEGVGWKYQGQHTLNLNDKSMGVAFIGVFDQALPSTGALASLQTVINTGLNTSKLLPTYKIYPHKDVECTTCPGGKLYTNITGMDHYGGKIGYPYVPCQSYSDSIHPQK